MMRVQSWTLLTSDKPAHTTENAQYEGMDMIWLAYLSPGVQAATGCSPFGCRNKSFLRIASSSLAAALWFESKTLGLTMTEAGGYC